METMNLFHFEQKKNTQKTHAKNKDNIETTDCAWCVIN